MSPSSAPAIPALPARSFWPASSASRPRSSKPTAWRGAAVPATAARRKTPPAGCPARNGSNAGASTSRDACMPRSRTASRPSRTWSAPARSIASRSAAAISTSRTAQRSLEKIAAESRILNDVFGYPTRVVSRAELRARFRRRGGSRRRRSRAARHRRSSGEARLRLSDHGSQARRQRASGKPGAADRTARRRIFAANTGRHGEGSRGRHRDRCIHLARTDAAVARAMHADPVQFARYPSADGG